VEKGDITVLKSVILHCSYCNENHWSCNVTSTWR